MDNYGDYISREAAVKAAQDGADEWDGGYNRNRDSYIECAIDEVPAADVRPVVRADWKQIGKRQMRFACSKCNSLNEKPTCFCPNCGAWMEES